MSLQVKFADVLIWKKFQFDDGETSDKLFLVLGAKPGKKVIGVITTSVEPPFKYNPGCSPDCQIYFCPAGKAFFRDDTWVQLYRPQTVSPVEIFRRSTNGQIRRVGAMPAQFANAIRNCLKGSDDITLDQIALLE